MKTIEVEYLEHGKLFKNGRASEFYDLAYTTGLNRYSSELRNLIGLDYRTPFSIHPGNISFAVIPVFGKSRYAFVQFQSRFENEFAGSAINRPYFQTKFLLFNTVVWRSLYEQGFSVLPSLSQANDTTFLLNTYSSVVGNVGKSLPVQIFDSTKKNNLFLGLDADRDKAYLKRISLIAEAILKYKGVREINLQDENSYYEKLMLVDSINQILLPIITEPISFALDPACTAKVDLRFGESLRNNRETNSLDFSGVSWQQAKSSMDDLVRILINNKGNWADQYQKIFSGLSTKDTFFQEMNKEILSKQDSSHSISILDQARQEKETREKLSKRYMRFFSLRMALYVLIVLIIIWAVIWLSSIYKIH